MPLAAVELSRLAKEGDVVVVRNTQPGIVVFGDDALHVSLTWSGHNDPAGGDVIECPATLLKSPKFREAMLRGILTIEEAPEVLQAALDAQRAEWEQRQQKAQGAELELQRNNDRVVGRGVSCIAPNGSKGDVCGSFGLAMGQNPTERPPLCSEHVHLASQYVASETGRIGDDGKAEIIWKRASVTRG